jgi:Arc/MetJ family transcription regulator
MATNLDLDDKLIDAARKLGGQRSKREAVTRALEKFVQWLRQQKNLSEFGKEANARDNVTRIAS